ncbi:proteasome accessory factor PafA2 family protein, partial [Corynebacterium sp.]
TPRTPTDHKVLAAWDEVVALLDKDPMQAAHLLDWVAKYRLIKGYLDRGVNPDDPKLRLIDLQYAEIDPAKSLHHALVRKGQMRQLFSAAEIERVSSCPPEDTRAYFRGRVTQKFGEDIIAASWQSLTVQVGEGTAAPWATVPMDIATGLTQAECGEMIDAADTVEDLLQGLTDSGIHPEYRN